MSDKATTPMGRRLSSAVAACKGKSRSVEGLPCKSKGRLLDGLPTDDRFWCNQNGSIRAPGLEVLKPPIWLPHVLVTLLLVPKLGMGWISLVNASAMRGLPHAVGLSIQKLRKAPDKHPLKLP